MKLKISDLYHPFFSVHYTLYTIKIISCPFDKVKILLTLHVSQTDYSRLDYD